MRVYSCVQLLFFSLRWVEEEYPPVLTQYLPSVLEWCVPAKRVDGSKNIQNSKSLGASEIFGSASFFVRLSSCLFIFVWQNYIFPLTKVFLLLLWNRIKISSNTNFSFQSTLFSSPLRHTSSQRVLQSFENLHKSVPGIHIGC